TTLNPSGSQPQGIAAGYYGTTGGPGTVGIANSNVNGTVTVNNNGNVTAAAGYGINAYNYGNGNVTVNEAAGTSVSGAQYGIGAFGNSKGTGSVAVNVGANATISGGSIFGIQAFVNGVGSVSVTTSAGDYITGGSSGINAQSQSGTDDATSSVSVIAHGTIHSGTLLTPNGSTPGGIVAGYSPNGSNSANGAVAGNVLVQSDATIVAAAGSGINAYNYGAGNVTVTTGATSSITGATSGNQANGINANALDGGNVSVTNGGFLTGGTGIFSSTNHGGSITIENDGQITATANSGINAQQASAGATGSVTIINTGTVVGAANRSAINVAENAAGTVTITNSGTIGSVATAGSTPAITETGGSTVTINNNGQIDGNVYTNSTGGFTGTFNNNAGATWLTGFLDDEGSITASGADSTIVLVGTSIGMTVGNSGTGNLTVAADAALTASFLNIANLAGSHGTVTVTGPGSTLNTTSGQFQNITVGNDGTASLTVSNQAVVTTTNMGVAYNFDADVTDTLTVDNATLNSTQGLTIANSGTANATVKNGGTITTGFLSLSNNAGSAGSLTVDGAGSVVTAQSMSLGSGSTTVTITNGGAVDIGPGTSTIAGALHIGSATSLGGAGKINGNVVDDGNLTAVGLLNITGILGGSGTININDGGTLELAGSGAENVFFTGGNGTLMLDNALGFTGTIAGSSGNSGNFTIAGQGNVTTAAGDAIDFTSGGGAVGSQANVIVTTSGTISGAVNGINAVQNGVGDVTVDPGASVTGRAGDGLIAEQSTTGTGNVTVNATGSVTGQGAGTMGLLAENLNAANAGNINVTSTGGASGAFDGIDVVNKGNGNISVEAGGAVAATVQFGIRTEQYGSGSTSVVMDPGSTIHSGGAGIAVIDYATSLLATANSTITVTNNSTINSGTTLNPSGSQPQGIAAGYYGNNGTANTAINGTVTINNNGNVTAAAGYGLDGYNYGNGNVTVNDGANTSVSGAQYGIGAFNNSKGSGSVAVNVGANSTVSGGSIFGIQAFVNGVGRVSVTTSAGDQITGGSSGINAQSQSGTDDATSSVTVIAHGTIHSGTLLTPNGSTPGGIVAGYSPNGSNSANGAVAGNVLVQSDATIVAAAGSGINAYNYGAGNVTVTTGAISSITGASSGAQANGINANTFAGGNISVTNGGFLTGGTGIFTGAALGGSITVENDGQITATANSGINVQQASASATGSVSITNTGTIVGAANKSAINVSENPFGTVTINNSGTIGLATATSTAALTENGGAAVIVNNNGQIYGNLYTNSTGGFTGAFNNNAGATLQASFIDDEGSVTASGAFSVVSVGGMGLGNTNSTASLNVNNGGAIVIGTGTSTIANAIHIGSSAGIGGAGVINGNVVNDGNIAANGLLHITGALSGSGMLNINNGGTLELAGSGAENFFFGGGNDTLKLDNAPGFTGTIAGSAANSGNFTITGQGSVTTSAGDGIDFTSAAGAVGSQANVIVTPGGAISGAVNGINVVQNGVGDIVVSPSGSVTGQAGNGVIAEQNITGIGSITVNATGSVTGQGTGSIGVFAENLDAANTGNINVTATGSVSGGLDGIYVVNHGSGNDSIEAGAVSATVQFGIRDESYGTGSMTTLTDAGNTINSGGAGISLVSFATSIGTGANSVITVTNNATINSGTTLNPSGSQPQGIAAGYYGTTG
ncbi:hypothetical protein, partial [Bradyrhizobium sp. Cp5.3]|uniref:beta strand repeat-containing protein n=1 Tax=Bradyrhizobium sp. Cp5.3 TaxID=443598 RepID=UPI0004828F10